MKLLALALLLSLAACAAHRSAPSGTVLVEMDTSMGRILVELDRAHAPITVDNFLMYMDRGAYDGTIFHRVVQNFVIQGGGFTPDLAERAKIDEKAGRKDVPIKNEWENGLKNVRGSIAMARDTDPDTATREFYINVADNARLDTAREKTGSAGYAVFGRVVAGMDVVDAIRNVKNSPHKDSAITDGSMDNLPDAPVIVKTMRRVTVSR